jgi:hypothetical protein
MRGLKTLLFSATLLAPLALLPMANAQISVNIGAPPVCSYGYYDYSPYACSPVGYYGPGYFYNGIFLGMGPWAGWGYNHGWGSHRFASSGGGRYTGGFHGAAVDRGRANRTSAVRTSSRGGSRTRASAGHSHAAVTRGTTSHATPSRASSHGASRATASHAGSHGASHAPASRGGDSHRGGGPHDGGGESHGAHH